jgi:hypothetical protein
MNKELFENLDKIGSDKLIKEWLVFREEEICTMNEEDKKYLIHFDEYFENVLKQVPISSHTEAKKELDNIYDVFMDYSTHWNEKFYVAGFRDAMQLIIFCLNN